jgi:hypothetical protein
MRFLHFFAASCLAIAATVTKAETKPDGLSEANDSNTVHRLAFPNPLFRLLAIEDTLKKGGKKIDWSAQYEKIARTKLNTDALKGKGPLGFAIGVRLADGSIALLAKDSGKLKAAAQDAQTCAEKLGLPRKQITTASSLARAIADNDWGTAFEEMGWIQQEIVSQIDNKDKNFGMTALVACGAWMQGVRYASSVVTENMNAQDLSNSLRGPAVIEAITAELAKLPDDVRNMPSVQECITVFGELKPLITIKRDETIPPEKLKKIHDLATRAVDAALK